MTTYGTIPTHQSPNPQSQSSQSNSNPSPQELITKATNQIKSHLATARPWSELISLPSLSFPPSFNDAISRIKTNLLYFRANYAIFILLSLFLSLLYHPVSLLVFIVMMGAWVFLYFLRDTPLRILGRVVDDNVVLIGLGAATVLFLLLTDVTVNIVSGVGIGVGIVLIHAAIRQIDDLRVEVGEFEDERVRFRSGFVDRLPMKDTASSAYSS